MQLINAENEEELDMLNNTNVPAIQRAVVVIRDMSADERIREAAIQRETMLHDKATALRFARDTGYTEGMEKGMEKGAKQERLRTVQNIIKNGNFSAEQALELAGIPSDEWDNYLKEL